MTLRDLKHQAPIVRGDEYEARHHGAYRDPAIITHVVLHSTESDPGTAKAVARYGHVTDRVVSWHFTVDDVVLVRCLPDDVVAWTAPPLNNEGLHIEIVGRASWSRARWYLHQATLKRAAWQVARWLVRYDIPARYVTDDELRRGVPGITFHDQVSRVFGKTDHTDPGKGFPREYMLTLIQRRVKWLKDK